MDTLMKRCVYFALLLLAMLSMNSLAHTTIKWGTDHWTGYTDYDGSGFYNELMRSIYPEPDFILDVQYYPWKRSLKYISQASIDMTGAVHITSTLYHSRRPIIIDRVVMVSRKQDALNIQLLNKKLGAYRSGYEDMVFYPYLSSAIMGVEVQDSHKGIALLSKEKVDFYVGADSMVQQALEARDDKAEFEISEIGQFELYWSFAKNPKGLALKNRFDQQLDVLREQGVLAQLYYKYDLTMPF